MRTLEETDDELLDMAKYVVCAEGHPLDWLVVEGKDKSNETFYGITIREDVAPFLYTDTEAAAWGVITALGIAADVLEDRAERTPH